MINIDHKYVHPHEVVKDISRNDLKGAKVFLLNMPVREQAMPNNAPLGLSLLAAKLMQYDVQVVVIDLNAYRVFDEEAEKRGLDDGRVITFNEAKKIIHDHIDKYGDQDLIAMSGLITTLDWQKDVAKMVKECQPDALLASGGGLATEFRGILFDWIPELNAVAHSEGDDVIVKLTYDAKQFRNNSKILATGGDNPYYLGEYKGVKRFLYDGGRPLDLDSIPFPAWQILEEDIYGNNIIEQYIRAPIWGTEAKNSSATPFSMERSLNTVSSRGCPFACKFCFRGAQGERNYGIRSSGNIAKEVESFSEKYSIDFMGFVDDNFAVDRRRIADLVESLGSVCSEHNIKWGTHARLDECSDILKSNGEGLKKRTSLRVDDMAKAGCAYIGFGAESADKHVLEAMGKGGSMLRHGSKKFNGYEFPVSMVEGVKNTFNSGIHSNCTWIMGYPTETLEQLKTSVAFIKWQEEIVCEGIKSNTEEYKKAQDSVNKMIFIATAYPGTEMFKDPKVHEALSKRFSLTFDKTTNDPIPDENMMNYVSKLNDASDVLYDEDEVPLYYGEMSSTEFSDVRDCIDNDNVFGILDL